MPYQTESHWHQFNYQGRDRLWLNICDFVSSTALTRHRVWCGIRKWAQNSWLFYSNYTDTYRLIKALAPMHSNSPCNSPSAPSSALLSKHETPENLSHQVYSLAKQMGFWAYSCGFPLRHITYRIQRRKALNLLEEDCIWIHISIKKWFRLFLFPYRILSHRENPVRKTQ